VLDAVQPAGDAAFERLAADRRDVLAGEPPQLGIHLAGDQDLVDESPSALLCAHAGSQVAFAVWRSPERRRERARGRASWTPR
jgi:hypothetical protein